MKKILPLYLILFLFGAIHPAADYYASMENNPMNIEGASGTANPFRKRSNSTGTRVPDLAPQEVVVKDHKVVKPTRIDSDDFLFGVYTRNARSYLTELLNKLTYEFQVLVYKKCEREDSHTDRIRTLLKNLALVLAAKSNELLELDIYVEYLSYLEYLHELGKRKYEDEYQHFSNLIYLERFSLTNEADKSKFVNDIIEASELLKLSDEELCELPGFKEGTMCDIYRRCLPCIEEDDRALLYYFSINLVESIILVKPLAVLAHVA